MQRKKFEEAADLYDQSLAAGGQKRIIVNLANSYVATGHFDKAIELYKAYLIENPNDIKARLELARALSYIGKFQEAEIEYEKVLEKGQKIMKK
ncbi:MAG: tetratricopeptide repeat protein [Parachlamydiaceae bacterium]|nr:MAG: tetratricopeptide repeat protein [Parachlamydiaceae bacterium]